MAYFKPCFNCATARKDCDTARDLSAKLRGSCITSVKFTCPNRKPKFAPGERVSVSWPVHNGDGYYEDAWTLESWPATISCESGNKFVIRVDDVCSDHDTPAREYIKSGTLYCKVSASKLKPLDEPARSICLKCNEIGGEGFKGCQFINGDHEFPVTPPIGCALNELRIGRAGVGGEHIAGNGSSPARSQAPKRIAPLHDCGDGAK